MRKHKDFKNIKQGKPKTYNKEVTLVVKKEDGRREIMRVLICPKEWKGII